MKPNRSSCLTASPRHIAPLRSLFTAIALAVVCQTASGQTSLFWDADGDSSAATGGTGAWDLTSSFWRDGSSTGPLGAWINDDPNSTTANFAGTAGTVTIATGTTINANGISFGVTGYTIAGTDATSLLNFSGATPTVNVTGTSSTTATISAVITGTGGFTKTGGGNLSLSGANTFSGGTTLNAGTIVVSNDSALGTGNLTVNGGTIHSGGAALRALTGNNTQTWNGDFTFHGGSTTDSHLNMGTGAVTMGNNISINLLSNGKGRFTVGGAISDGGSGFGLTITSVGTGASAANQLILSGNNTYSGGTVLNSGGIAINSNNALGTGTLTINGGALSTPTSQTRTLSNTIILNTGLMYGNSNAINAAGTLNLAASTLALTANRSVTVNQGTLNISSVVDDSTNNYGITFIGGRFTVGTLALSGANTFDGGVTVQTNGHNTTLNIGNLGTTATASALGTGTFVISSAGGTGGNNIIRINNTSGAAGTLATNNAQVWDADFTFGAAGSALDLGTGAVSLGSASASATRTVTVSQNLTVGGVISNGVNTTGLTKAGNATLFLTGANTYSGGTTVTGGTLAGTTTGLQGNITNNATVRFDQTLPSTPISSGTYAGNISGTGAVTKTNAGTVIFTGTHSYTGATTVSGGALIVNGSHTGGGAYTISSGATLGGSGNIGSTVNINNGGLLSPGNSPGTLTLGSLNMLNGSTYVFEGGDLVAVTGQLDLDENWTLTLTSGFQNGGSVVLFTYGSLAVSPDLLPTFDISGLGFTPTGPLSLTDTGSSILLNGVSMVPEPSACLLLAVGLAAAVLGRRRKAPLAA